jgi:hypothetical protein
VEDGVVEARRALEVGDLEADMSEHGSELYLGTASGRAL